MPHTIDSALSRPNVRLVRRPATELGSYVFQVGSLTPEITVKLYELAGAKGVWWDQSHYIETPEQGHKYATSRPWGVRRLRAPPRGDEHHAALRSGGEEGARARRHLARPQHKLHDVTRPSRSSTAFGHSSGGTRGRMVATAEKRNRHREGGAMIPPTDVHRRRPRLRSSRAHGRGPVRSRRSRSSALSRALTGDRRHHRCARCAPVRRRSRLRRPPGAPRRREHARCRPGRHRQRGHPAPACRCVRRPCAGARAHRSRTSRSSPAAPPARPLVPARCRQPRVARVGVATRCRLFPAEEPDGAHGQEAPPPARRRRARRAIRTSTRHA